MKRIDWEAASTPAWRLRASIAAGIIAATFVMVLYARQESRVISDWDPTWVATRALLRGQSPYEAIQVPPWPNWLLYPLPALLLTIPFTFLPLWLARGIFVGLGTGAFTYVVTRRGRWALYLVMSGAMLWSWIDVQWAPLLVAVALTPTLSWMLAVKPTAGFALWFGFPNWKALVGGVVLLAISMLVRPNWIPEWLASVARTPHAPHLLRPGGALLLLGLVRWRRPDGRLLAALCLIPQTTALYEVLPLALVPQNRKEAAAFAGLTMLAHLLFQAGPQGPWPVGASYQWWVLLFLVYLPAIGLVLARPDRSLPAAHQIRSVAAPPT